MSHAPQLARDRAWMARDIYREPTSPDGPLAGLSFAAKDLFQIGGEITRAGSAVFDEDTPAENDAALIATARHAGAALHFTTNMDALAYGFVTNNPEYGRACNPHDSLRICGGSSGGSAAAVSAGLVDFALGTDTSGSIRVPAAFCGTFGYKPSAGVFSNQGVQPLSPTYDRPGIFARDASTLSRVAHALALPGTLDSTDIMPNKIAMLGGPFVAGLDPAVEESVCGFSDSLVARTGIEVPGVQAARAATYILVADEAAQIHGGNLRSHPERFDPETRHRLAAASLIKPEWCNAARKIQADFAWRFECLFEDFDILLAPCVNMIAPFAEDIEKPRAIGQPPLRASLGLLTQPISLIGAPVVAIPLSTPIGLPTAIQLIGRIGSDAMLLNFAKELGSQI